MAQSKRVRVLNELVLVRLYALRIVNDAVSYASSWLDIDRVMEIEKFFGVREPPEKVEASVKEVDD